jgi:hypothetical protein
VGDLLYVGYDHYRIAGAPDLREPQTPLTINILEFATVVFLIMVTAPLLRGKVLSIGSDNTATLCWLVKNRASCGAADNLLKFLSLVCTIYHIRLVVHHVRGIYNNISDWISRVTGIPHADPHAAFDAIDTTSALETFPILQAWLRLPVAERPDRRLICRILLTLALTTEVPFTMQQLLNLMLLLRDLPDISKPLVPDVAKVIDAYQSLDRSIRPQKIPGNIYDALQAAKIWSPSTTSS